ncbi:hypothetical protein ALP25_05382 [Pseudomonas syringae pv. syringae]|nr:hypothetical protein ALP25_05382 [Pseudomonas syringae pv. syringae]
MARRSDEVSAVAMVKDSFLYRCGYQQQSVARQVNSKRWRLAWTSGTVCRLDAEMNAVGKKGGALRRGGVSMRHLTDQPRGEHES